MSSDIKLEVSAGGIFSKFIFVIQNIRIINPDFQSIYIQNIDERSLIGDQNIFDSIFEQEENTNQVTYVSKHLGNYSKFLPIEDSDNLSVYKKIVNKLVFKQEIKDRLDYLLNSLKIDENFIGVHIRLCDMNIHHKNDYGYVGFEDFLREIKGIKKEGQKIFVASDNKESIEKLKFIYGDDVVCIESFIRGEVETEDTLNLQMNNFQSPEFWKQAFIEMLILSKCGTLICRTSNLNNVSIIYSNTIGNIIRL